MTKKAQNKDLILGIDTSCDETSVAILENDRILANVISSQVELHKKYGGVVPAIARREHEAKIDYVILEALKNAGMKLNKILTIKDIDAVAVTYGPGLAIALEVGIKRGKELAEKYNKKLIAVNHMEGHLLSSLGLNSNGNGKIDHKKLKFPVLGLLISGGHTQLILMKAIGKYELLGETLDDAVGEAYDKTARMLGLGYPGGSVLTEMAKKGDETKVTFPIPMAKDPSLNFSFSGLKTAVYYTVKKLTENGKSLTKEQVYDFSRSFEVSAISQLQIKLEKAIKKVNPEMILVGGGVSASAKVRSGLRKIARKYNTKIYFPTSKLATDNGAMIALAGYFKYQRKEFASMDLDREPNAVLVPTT